MKTYAVNVASQRAQRCKLEPITRHELDTALGLGLSRASTDLVSKRCRTAFVSNSHDFTDAGNPGKWTAPSRTGVRIQEKDFQGFFIANP